MSQAISAAISWPMLEFAPVNLWSLPAAWKGDPETPRNTRANASQSSGQFQVNPHIQRILANR